MRTDVLGVKFDQVTPEEALAQACALMADGGFHYAVTPNPEFILEAQKNEPFAQALDGADLVLPDGVGVLYAAKILGRPLKARVTGMAFACGLLGRMAAQNIPLYLLGAKPGVAARAAEQMARDYPGLCVCGTRDGYFEDDAPVAEEIRAAGAQVVFVCLGAPKQELWMARHGPATGARLMVGLGGCLDVFAGDVQRAPAAMQKMGLEWLYRLATQPKRAGRMARLPLVLVQACGARLQGR
ncbi:MAG: WecB/TagA/CpsF family glycosyltransferase [Oscillospiraceae bacterium]|nr:WecB/TagA/CpsF family glycosyltransferase [Oscillospiraceae bacterium]